MLVRRAHLKVGENDQTSYEFGLTTDNKLYASMVSRDGLTLSVEGARVIQPSIWQHVAGQYDAVSGRLTVFVNGVAEFAAFGTATMGVDSERMVEHRIGAGFTGLIDDITIASSAQAVSPYADVTSLSSATRLFYHFNDGGQLIQDFADSAPGWTTGWASAPTSVNGTVVLDQGIASPDLSLDADNDGVPDWWERLHYGDTSRDGTFDGDNDGLTDLYEYLAGLNPHSPVSLNDGVADGNSDLDSDGLTNLEEQANSTLPLTADTDDDGLLDGEEVSGIDNAATAAQPSASSDPASSLSPVVPRAFALDGNGDYISLPNSERLVNATWTVEASIRLNAGETDGGTIVRGASEAMINYHVALAGDLRPYAEFTFGQPDGSLGLIQVGGSVTQDLQAGVFHQWHADADTLIQTERWTHIAATFDPAAGLFVLYIDGAAVATRSNVTVQPTALAGQSATATVGAPGPGATLGQSFHGHIDDVRIWGTALSAAQIQNGFQFGLDDQVSVPAASVEQQLAHPHEAQQLHIGFASGMDAQTREAILASAGLTKLSRHESINANLVEVANGDDMAAKMTALAGTPGVRYVEPNYILTASAFPNDPRFDELWGLHNTGQTGGIDDADIDGPEIWDQNTGSRDVIVGIIDTGVDYNHEDLAANMWTNPGETPGNGIDDDGNGLVDDVYGWDWVDNDNDPVSEDVGVHHGTHVAGTVGAVGDNGVGVTGVSWNVQLMALRFLGANGSGLLSDAISAINYATAQGATLTCNSWGGGGFSQAMVDAIAAAGRCRPVVCRCRRQRRQ